MEKPHLRRKSKVWYTLFNDVFSLSQRELIRLYYHIVCRVNACYLIYHWDSSIYSLHGYSQIDILNLQNQGRSHGIKQFTIHPHYIYFAVAEYFEWELPNYKSYYNYATIILPSTQTVICSNSTPHYTHSNNCHTLLCCLLLNTLSHPIAR